MQTVNKSEWKLQTHNIFPLIKDIYFHLTRDLFPLKDCFSFIDPICTYIIDNLFQHYYYIQNGNALKLSHPTVCF